MTCNLRVGIKPVSPGSKTPCSSAPGSTPQSPRAFRVPGSRTPGPSPSKIPTPSKTTSKLPKVNIFLHHELFECSVLLQYSIRDNMQNLLNTGI